MQTSYINYLDELTLEIGVKPDLFSLLLKDLKLAVQLYFGPCNSYQYRLKGPGRWEGARSAILTQKQRILKPLKTHTLEPPLNFPVSFQLKILGLLAVVVAFSFSASVVLICQPKVSGFIVSQYLLKEKKRLNDKILNLYSKF